MPLYPPNHPLFSSPMAWGGRSHSGCGKISSAPRGHIDSRLIAVTKNLAESYHVHTPPQIQAEISLVEENIWVIWRFLTNEEVQANTISWVPDIGCILSHKSKYMKRIEIYWYIKSLLGWALLDKKGWQRRDYAPTWQDAVANSAHGP
jgi:hypothetical protein